MAAETPAPSASATPSVYPEGVSWAMEIPPQTLCDVFETAAGRFAGRPMIDFLGKHYDYAEIEDLVFRCAKGLQNLGIGKGMQVGLFLPNCPVSVIAYFGVLKTGATVVNYNPLYAEQELIHQIADSDTTLMITLDLKLLMDKLSPLLNPTHPKGLPLKRLVVARMADLLPWPKNWLFPLVKRAEIARWHPDSAHISWNDLLANDGHPQEVAIDAATDVAVLQYTGGTTGVPKGAMLTHANLAANTEQCAAWFVGASEGHERTLGVLPFFHVFAMTAVMNMSIRLGAEIVLLPRFELEQVLQALAEKKISLFPAVPTIFAAINRHPARDRYDLSSIRFCVSGGAPLPVEVRETFMHSTGCSLVEGYGLTEASPVAACNPAYGVNKPGSIGLPLPGTSIDIVSLEDPTQLAAPGEKGEVCIRGPQVMLGYWRRPAETAEALDGGHLHTGDVGLVDEDGYIYIVDRIKDVILCSGFNVYPRNVEDAIYQHPAVAECAVAGLPDSYRGQTVKAYIRTMDGHSLTHEELVSFLSDKLSPMEMPKLVEFRPDLPKTMIGKISRKALLEEEARRAADSTAAKE